MALAFSAMMELQGINPFVRVSAARAARLKAGWRKPMPVTVRINGKPEIPWRINMMPAGDGAFHLYLHGKVRKDSGTRVGDKVKVEVGFDGTYEAGPAPMPSWLRAALAAHPQAKRAFAALPPSRKKEMVRYLVRLKSEEARERNLVKALEVLSGAKMRFMARDWDKGR